MPRNRAEPNLQLYPEMADVHYVLRKGGGWAGWFLRVQATRDAQRIDHSSEELQTPWLGRVSARRDFEQGLKEILRRPGSAAGPRFRHAASQST